MRPQQNRRMRGRGNNNNNNNNNQNRKGPNPLTRSYESNGPDVKIRGSAQQIAEKYTTLARDAQTSGDRVMAENYLQHAEHYNRIILVAQAQMPQQPVRDNRDDDDGDEDGDDNNVSQNRNDQNRNDDGRNDDGRNDDGRGDQGRGNQGRGDRGRGDQQQDNRSNGTGPQPVIEGVPAEVALKQGGEGSGQQNAQADGNPGDGEGGDDAPRRPRRPRRQRAKAAEPEGSDDHQQTGEEPVTEAAQ
jgi:hypothetical protein